MISEKEFNQLHHKGYERNHQVLFITHVTLILPYALIYFLGEVVFEVNIIAAL